VVVDGWFAHSALDFGDKRMSCQRATTTAHNLRLFRKLELVLCRLDAGGVPIIVLKGAALAQEVYRNAGLRPMADLDLLVRGEDEPLRRWLLSTLGYESLCPDLGDDTDTYGHAVMLVHSAAAAAALDIHSSQFRSLYHSYRVPMD
jgi:hypothetical protein